jgi:hypothetical protein
MDMKRREFLTRSSLAGAAALSGVSGLQARADGERQEYYELRVYEMPTGNRKAPLNDYLSKAAIPAWNRLGIKPVGAFSVVSGANALMLYVLLPHPDLESFQSAPARMLADTEYQKAAAAYNSLSIDNPAYIRYQAWLLRAFKNFPKVRVPTETAGKSPRIFEFRIYESHSETAAIKKIEMFNDGGEIALFEHVGLRPVFFGQTLAGPRQPNLAYMLVHTDMPTREKTWAAFSGSDGWKKLSTAAEYVDTVSATTVAFLRPTAYSQI